VRPLWRASLVAAAAMAVTACGSGGDAPTAGSTDPAAALPEPPPGYVARLEESGGFDLDRYAAELSIAPDADRAVLEAAGFTRGAVRAWSRAEGGVAVTVYVFGLGDAAGAAAVQEHFVVDGRELLGADAFEVPGIAGAQGASYDRGTAAAPTRVHAVYLTNGPLFVNVLASHLDTGAGPDVAVEFARRAAAAGR